MSFSTRDGCHFEVAEGDWFVLMRPYRDQKLKIRNSNSKGMTKILKDPVQIAYRLIDDKLFFGFSK